MKSPAINRLIVSHTSLAGAVASVVLLGAASVLAYASGPTSEIVDSVDIPTYNDSSWNSVDEMSGLAWDDDEKILYGESDQGVLIKFEVDIAGDKIASVEPVAFLPLQMTVGDRTYSDAEDITILNGANGQAGDTQLAVVFEDGPAAGLFDGEGTFVRQIDLPLPLRDPETYSEPNQTVESIATSADHGFLFIPQVSRKGEKGLHTVYAEDGSSWSYPTLQTERTNTKSAQTQPDGSILLLEGVNLGGFWSALDMGTHEIHLRRLYPDRCTSPETCEIVDYAPKDTAAMTDRFEGLTRVGDNLYLIITDQSWGARLALVRTSP
jgi:hypothetical protein